MKRKHKAFQPWDFMWQAATWLFSWVLLFTLLVGFVNYLVLCINLEISPFLNWGSMTSRQQSMIINLVISVLIFALFLTVLLTILYRNIIYLPVKSLLGEAERTSGYEGLSDPVELYLRGGKKNIFDLFNPRQLWSDRVKEYIDNVTKERYFDETTGCFNRKYFAHAITEILKTQMLCSLSHKKDPLNAAYNYYGMYLLDIDHFKMINDEFGHMYGDQVLGLVGNTLRSVIGSEGVVVRNGGEEFLVIVCLNYPMDYSKLAEKMRREFSETVYVTNQRTQEIRPLTCSIGFLPFPFFKENLTALSVEQHVNLADQAMYLAKSGGRNTWRGLAALSTPSVQSEFEQAATSVEYGVQAGYYGIQKPPDTSEW